MNRARHGRAWVVRRLGMLLGLLLGFLPMYGRGMPAGMVQAGTSTNPLVRIAHSGTLPAVSSLGGATVSMSAALQTSVTVPVTSTVALTTTTISIYGGNVCAVWGRTAGAFASVTVPAGPLLLSFTTYSHYTDKPHYEYKYTFTKRVGDTTAVFTLDGHPLPVLYRGELRIEYLPVPVSKRYSYTTYSLVTLAPGDYDVAGDWHFASGEKDLPRRCHLAVTP